MSDHIPDVTKMIGETPRTDQFIGEDSEWSPAKPKNWPAFARQLERELNAANDRIKRLEAFVNRFLNPDDLGWAIGKFDRDEAREALGKERVESKAKEAKP